MAAPHVFCFHSGMYGAPQLSGYGQAGELIDLLTVCGQTGFGAVTLDSLAQVGGVATATCSTGIHLADGIVGMPHAIEISGSTNGWNGVYPLSAAPSMLSCQFAVPDNLPSPATGNITLQRAPFGLERLYAQDGRAVFGFPDALVMPGFLLIDDQDGQLAYARLAEAAASEAHEYGAMLGLCPAVVWRKTASSNAGNRAWVLVGWAGGFYLFVAWANSGYYDQAYAGACITRRAADAYPGILIGATSQPSQPGFNHSFLFKGGSGSQGQYLQRAYHQVGSAVDFCKTGMNFGTMIGQALQGPPDPNPVDNVCDLWGPIAISEGSSNNGTPLRGFMPGLWDPINAYNRSTFDILQNMPNLPGRKVLLVQCGYGGTAYPVGIDLTGPYGAA